MADNTELFVQRTLMFDDGNDRHEEFTHVWSGHTAKQAYDKRLRSLRSSKANLTADPANLTITVRRRRDTWTEIETLTFSEVSNAF